MKVFPMPRFKLPEVKLIPIGKKTSKGIKVDAAFISNIYSTMLPSDPLFARGLTERRIQQADIMHASNPFNSKYFAIENSAKQIVGATSISNPSLFDDVWFVSDTFVVPVHRGKRYAASSKIEIEKIARAEGVELLQSIMYKNNTSSIRSIRKAGFTKSRTKEKNEDNFFRFRKRLV